MGSQINMDMKESYLRVVAGPRFSGRADNLHAEGPKFNSRHPQVGLNPRQLFEPCLEPWRIDASQWGLVCAARTQQKAISGVTMVF